MDVDNGKGHLVSKRIEIGIIHSAHKFVDLFCSGIASALFMWRGRTHESKKHRCLERPKMESNCSLRCVLSFKFMFWISPAIFHCSKYCSQKMQN